MNIILILLFKGSFFVAQPCPSQLFRHAPQPLRQRVFQPGFFRCCAAAS